MPRKPTTTPAALKPNDLVQHRKSGKVYSVLSDGEGGVLFGSSSTRIGVVGQRDGHDFGPVRFLWVDDLVPCEARDAS